MLFDHILCPVWLLPSRLLRLTPRGIHQSLIFLDTNRLSILLSLIFYEHLWTHRSLTIHILISYSFPFLLSFDLEISQWSIILGYRRLSVKFLYEIIPFLNVCNSLTIPNHWS